MNSDDIRPDPAIEYQNLLNLLTRTLKYLESIDADPKLLRSYKQLLRYLRTRSATTIPEILGYVSLKPDSSAKRAPELSNEEILAMSVQQILDLAANADTPRKNLEKIATVRFGMTRGGLSTLRSRDALAEKLRTLIRNESAHDSISRVAGKPRPA